MVGIVSYGVYIPLWRLKLNLASGRMSGEKAVANQDEDSLTMAAMAIRNCLIGIDRRFVDGLFVASTTFPYTEKQNASFLATVADLRRDIITADFACGLRAGTTAFDLAVNYVKANPGKRIIVVASDCRPTAAGSESELSCGDGAAAVLIGDGDIAATVYCSYSISDELFDHWRSDKDAYIRSWEDRFVREEGYLKVIPEAVSGLMEKCNMSQKDFAKVTLCVPEAGRHRALGRILGFNDVQLQDPLFGSVGNTGASYPLILLVAALETAKADDHILVTSYGNGCDTYALQVTAKNQQIADRKEVSKYINSKKLISDYDTYLQWRGILIKEAALRRPNAKAPSASALWRDRSRNLSLQGVRCKVCGTVQYPPQRVCFKCHNDNNEQFEEVVFSDKRGKVVTYSQDYLAGNQNCPEVIAVVNFDGGGRLVCLMADSVENQIRIDLPVEMTLRRLGYSEGIYNYYWKCQAIR